MDFLSSMPGAIAQGLIWGLLAIGVYLTFRILDFADLTCEGSICTGAAVFAVLYNGETNVAVALLCAFLSGALAGALTGAFHTLLKIPAILSGILTQQILWTVNLRIMGSANQFVKEGAPVDMLHIGKSIWILLLFLSLFIAALYWFFGSERGTAIRATGNNQKMARAQGIHVEANQMIALALSNGIIAVSGALLCQYMGLADVSMGRGAIVVGLAAVIIGEAIVKKIGKNFAVRLLGVVLGSVVYWMIYQAVLFFGIDADYLKMLAAVIVALLLAVPYLKNKWFPKKNGGKKNA